MMKKQSIFFMVVLMFGMVSFVFPSGVSACEEGSFENLNGPTVVEFGKSYTYSVYPRGAFESVNWSAAGGDVLKTWNDGKTYFAEVRWTHKDSQKGARVKAWGKDGCGTMRDARLWVNPDAKRDPGAGRGVPGVAAQFYDLYDAKGDHFSASQDQSKLSSAWDNRVSSIWVAANREVIIYEGPHFNGQPMILQGGQKGALYNLPDRFNNNVSSFTIR